MCIASSCKKPSILKFLAPHKMDKHKYKQIQAVDPAERLV